MKIENLTKAVGLNEQLVALRAQRRLLADPYQARVDHIMQIRVADHVCTLDRPRILAIVNTEIDHVLDQLKSLGIEGAEK